MNQLGKLAWASGTDEPLMSDLFSQPGRELDGRRLSQLLEPLEREIPDDPQPLSDLTPRGISKLQRRLQALIQKLSSLSRAIDPIKHYDVYDPSHPISAADLISERLLRQQRVALNTLERFYGAGVYALYYVGDHPAYTLISGTEIPVYVGKAEASDAHAHSAVEQGDKLYYRLAKDHARSIREVEKYPGIMGTRNERGIHPLRLQDFECRFLVLASAYAGAVERSLINHYVPVWNKEAKVCIGFGKHGDDANTRANTRSDWDTIHPGRDWATREGNVPNPRTPQEIGNRICLYCERVYSEVLTLRQEGS
jgi:hypothetical protein